MYKKLLLASAVAAFATGAQAATWHNVPAVTMPVHTNEGAQATSDAAGGVEIGESLIMLGAEYSVNDVVTFTLNTPKASGSNWPTTVNGNTSVAYAAGADVLDGTIAEDDTTLIVDHNGNGTKSSDNFAVGDRIKFNSSAVNEYQITANNAGTDVITFTPGLKLPLPLTTAVVTNTDLHDVTLTLTGGGALSATYRVSSLGTGATSVGSLIVTPTVNVTAAGLAAVGTAQMTFSAATATGTAMDALATAKTLASSKAQWTQTVTGFNGIIDVGALKKKFTGGVSSDAVSVKHVEILGTAGAAQPAIDGSGVLSSGGSTTALAAAASSTSVVNTLSGSFSYLDQDAATAGVQVSVGAAVADELTIAGTGCTGSVSTAGVVKVTDDISSGANCTATVTNVGAAVLPVQAYTNTATYTFTPAGGNAATKTAVAKAAGKWALNGASVRAYGVPMGSHVDRFIWINNKGSLAGAFTYSVVMNGSSYGPFPLGTVGAMKSMSVATLVDVDLAARGINIAPSSRATMTFAAPVKQADVVVTASYKHIADADRVALETSDSLNATGK